MEVSVCRRTCPVHSMFRIFNWLSPFAYARARARHRGNRARDFGCRVELKVLLSSCRETELYTRSRSEVCYNGACVIARGDTLSPECPGRGIILTTFHSSEMPGCESFRRAIRRTRNAAKLRLIAFCQRSDFSPLFALASLPVSSFTDRS